GDVDHLITKQVFAFDTEQHVTIRHRHRDHDGRSLARAKRVFIDDDLDTLVAITEIGRRVGGNKHVCFCFHWRQEAIAFHIDALAALPRHAIETLALGREVQLRDALAVSLHCLREYVVMLITAKLQSPTSLASRWKRWKEVRLLLQTSQFFALYFAATRIDPDFPPVITRDFHRAFGLHRLLVGVERLDVDRDLVFRTVDVICRARVDVITLPRHA